MTLKFRGKMGFAHVNQNSENQTRLLENFNIDKHPSIVVFEAVVSEESDEAVETSVRERGVIKGKKQFKEIEDFFIPFAENTYEPPPEKSKK